MNLFNIKKLFSNAYNNLKINFVLKKIDFIFESLNKHKWSFFLLQKSHYINKIKSFFIEVFKKYIAQYEGRK
ncbi:hypothetical protein DD829_18500 [Chryseobacterium sp. HMWF035]|nr:hypothetical protein DD829_18500 [Chryseobacterium sp. HMWF035]